jgi:integrase
VERWPHPATGPLWLCRATPRNDIPLLPNGLTQRFEQLAHATGIPDTTPRQLRHAVGIYLLARGMARDATAGLRHRDLATTLRLYPNAVPHNDELAAETLADLYELTTMDIIIGPHTTDHQHSKSGRRSATSVLFNRGSEHDESSTN